MRKFVQRSYIYQLEAEGYES